MGLVRWRLVRRRLGWILVAGVRRGCGLARSLGLARRLGLVGCLGLAEHFGRRGFIVRFRDERHGGMATAGFGIAVRCPGRGAGRAFPAGPAGEQFLVLLHGSGRLFSVRKALQQVVDAGHPAIQHGLASRASAGPIVFPRK
jgi:hypothetical protein